eukprot:2256264-Pyramimonas_sp.AAC.1
MTCATAPSSTRPRAKALTMATYTFVTNAGKSRVPQTHAREAQPACYYNQLYPRDYMPGVCVREYWTVNRL